MSDQVPLAELGVEQDPGTEWHPKPEKVEVRDEEGHLKNLSLEDVLRHAAKPEAKDQIDGQRSHPLAAEDSRETPPGVI